LDGELIIAPVKNDENDAKNDENDAKNIENESKTAENGENGSFWREMPAGWIIPVKIEAKWRAER
jgi:hypothetical protein